MTWVTEVGFADPDTALVDGITELAAGSAIGTEGEDLGPLVYVTLTLDHRDGTRSEIPVAFPAEMLRRYLAGLDEATTRAGVPPADPPTRGRFRPSFGGSPSAAESVALGYLAQRDRAVDLTAGAAWAGLDEVATRGIETLLRALPGIDPLQAGWTLLLAGERLNGTRVLPDDPGVGLSLLLSRIGVRLIQDHGGP